MTLFLLLSCLAEDPHQVPVILERDGAVDQVMGIVLGANLNSAEHNHEGLVSRLPDLHALAAGDDWQPVTQDSPLHLQDCVDVVKAMDSEHATLITDVGFESCNDRRGSVDVRHQMAGWVDGSLPTVSEVVFAGYQEDGVELDGIVLREDHHALEGGALTTIEEGHYTAFIDVTDEVALTDSLVVVPLELSSHVELVHDLVSGQVQVSGQAEVWSQGRNGQLSFDGIGNGGSCSQGGWSSGSAELTVDGVVQQIDLSCETGTDGAKFALIDVITAIVQAAAMSGGTVTSVYENDSLGLSGDSCLEESEFLAFTNVCARLHMLNVQALPTVNDLLECLTPHYPDVRLGTGGLSLDGSLGVDAVSDPEVILVKSDGDPVSAGTDVTHALTLDCTDDDGLVGIDGSLAGLNLDHTNLHGRDLSGVDFQNASLVGADLSSANLTGANLTGAELGTANLTDVNWTHAICSDGRSSEDNGGSCS